MAPDPTVLLRRPRRLHPRWRGLGILALYAGLGGASLWVAFDSRDSRMTEVLALGMGIAILAVAGPILLLQVLVASGLVAGLRVKHGGRGAVISGPLSWLLANAVTVAPGDEVTYSVRPKCIWWVDPRMFTLPPTHVVVWTIERGLQRLSVWMCVMPDQRMIDEFEQGLRELGARVVRDD